MENGPVLKKVRRPINRSIPVSSSEPIKVSSDKPITSDTVVSSPQTTSENTKHRDIQQLPAVERVSPQRDEKYYDDNQSYEREYYEDDLPDTGNGIYVSIKVFILVLVISLVIGLFMGRFLFGGKQITQNGLQGVVINTEVPRGRARCGVADRTQGCVIYIMNSQRQNMRAKDFYDLAAQVTGRQKFMIETGNMRYANVEIRPGDIAQINIPPL